MNALLHAGQRYIESRLARIGFEGVRIVRKFFLGLFLALAGVIIFTAGAFITIVDAFSQSQLTGSIQFSPTLTFGIILMLVTGALFAWGISERRWIKSAKLDRILQRTIQKEQSQTVAEQNNHPVTDEPKALVGEDLYRIERRLKRLIDERMNKALRDWERSNARRDKDSRSFTDDMIH